MAELIYSVKDIFSKDTEGCLGQNNAEKYHIAAYQRGYKWSTVKDGQVSILFSDLQEAFEKNPNRDYFLQYITVKKPKNNINSESRYLEVIDGQQRLTTLSILFEIFNTLNSSLENIAFQKLEYAIRGNLFEDKINKQGSAYWENENLLEDIKEQDSHYLLSAGFFFYRKLNKTKTEDFYTFLCNRVMIIVNAVEPHINSEKVFKNLNSNKVALTDAELVKGLLLTKTAREGTNNEKGRHFTEIMEYRANMGRQWDIITTWAKQKEIKFFFFKDFKEKEYVESILDKYFFGDNKQSEEITEITAILLLLCSLTVTKGELSEFKDNKYYLFNYFFKKTKEKSVTGLFIRLQEIHSTLKDWYEDIEIYNLLGYQFFYKKSPYKEFERKIKFISEIIDKDKANLKKFLHEEKNKILDNITIGTLKKENDQDLHKVFLALNVFDYINLDQKNPTKISKAKYSRFDFLSFDKESWDVEHIFPSTPDAFPDELGKDDIGLIKAIYEENKDKITFESLKNIYQGKTEEEFQIDLNRLVELFKSKEKVNLDTFLKHIIHKATSLADIKDTIGNLCLLTYHVNRGIQNGMFNDKRKLIINKIALGHFVPIHTFKVFAKLVSPQMDETLKVWNRKDINAHQQAIENKVNAIKIDK